MLAGLLLVAGTAVGDPWIGTPSPTVAGYSVQSGDCGYPVCATLMAKGEVPHKTMDDIAAICNATAGCEGFNSNGWLKGCLPPRCPAGLKGMEPAAPSYLYTKIGAPEPAPPPAPPAPVPDIEDAFYPTEEAAERAAAAVPTVASAGRGTCVLVSPAGGARATAAPGDAVFGGNWTVLAVYAGGEVALERRWARWSLLVLANPAGRSLALRRPLGDVGKISLARYDLAAVQPDYFQRAASDPKDYIGQRIITDSEHGEASFLTAAKFLPPIADFVVIGDTGAPVKAVVAMDGTVKRSDGGDDSRGQCCHLDAPQYAEWIVVNGMQWGHLNGSTAHG